MSFDIVILLGPNEISYINNQITNIKKFIIGFRKIFIITDITKIKEIKDCKLIDENIFSEFKDYISNFFKQYNGKSNRNGWYFQQLVKLYAGLYIEDLNDDYLVIDADIFFLKHFNFIEDNKYIFTTGSEYHIPYFKHMERLHPDLKKYHKDSGISHHMIFNRNLLKELFSMVENHHKESFWKVFINMIEEHKNYPIDSYESGASEYEIYFNFMIKNHYERIKIRNLNWKNVGLKKKYPLDLLKLDYYSVCSYLN